MLEVCYFCAIFFLCLQIDAANIFPKIGAEDKDISLSKNFLFYFMAVVRIVVYFTVASNLASKIVKM